MVWPGRHCDALISWTLLSLILCSPSYAQQISTSTPVPPLQWINLTRYLTGSSAPPLKDASIGYDDTTRTLLIFGGESAQNIKQSSTYLLKLDSLEWVPPAPPPNLQGSPPARSAAISGDDFAASYRNAHIVIGGLGSNNEALADVWEFDYTSQFWSSVNLSPGGPSARYGAVGGIDTRTQAASSPTLATPNNTFYLIGGIDDETVSPLSDVWQLNVTGTLTSNNPTDVYASWEQVTVSASNIPSKVGAAGAVVSQGATQMIAAVGGCSSSIAFTPNASCAQPDPYIINVDAETMSVGNACPAPRLDPTVVANFNSLNNTSTVFNPQVFLLLGLTNNSLWSDQGGLERGEVDVLNINTGEWARILPAGDPGSTAGGTPSYPTPRQGAVGLSYQQTLVGSNRDIASDTIVFGGADADGNYLQEVWILRAYNAELTQSNQKWSGFGDGQLVGGVDATGQGVTIQYMTECASALSPKATQTTAFEPTSTPTGTGTGSPSPSSSTSTSSYDTSVVHRALAPISIALVMPAVIFLRLSSPAVTPAQVSGGYTSLLLPSVVLGLAAYGLGIAGLATSFTSITSTYMSVAKRSTSSSNILKTAHGKAGLALFICFYGVVPVLFALSLCFKRHSARTNNEEGDDTGDGRHRANSNVTAEKEGLFPPRVTSPSRQSVDGQLNEPRRRVRSWGGIGSLGVSGRRSSDSGLESTSHPSSPHTSFEVTNRPARTRRVSGNSLAAFSDPRPSGTPRNLSDLSWFDRRRSLNTVGEMDYALGHMAPRGADPSTPGTLIMDMTSTSGLMASRTSASPEMPRSFDSFLHVLFHALLLGLCILSLIALWQRAPRAAFIVFLVGTLVFYIIEVTLAWYGRPQISVLTVLVSRLRGDPVLLTKSSNTPVPSRPLSAAGSEVPFPTTAAEYRGPYQHHHPPFRTTMSAGLDEYPTSVSHGHGTTEVDEDDEEDEDSRQRRIEEELSRRDVSIVTVPKRKLFLTNPGE